MAPTPEPRTIRTARDAELAACEWLGWMGFADAQVGPLGADGGIDVAAGGIVAQVKAQVKPVGRPVVQQILGAASNSACKAALFSLSGYTDQATAFANSSDVALFEYNYAGQPEPVNPAARVLYSRGNSMLEILTDRVEPLLAGGKGVRAIPVLHVTVGPKSTGPCMWLFSPAEGGYRAELYTMGYWQPYRKAASPLLGHWGKAGIAYTAFEDRGSEGGYDSSVFPRECLLDWFYHVKVAEEGLTYFYRPGVVVRPIEHRIRRRGIEVSFAVQTEPTRPGGEAGEAHGSVLFQMRRDERRRRLQELSLAYPLGQSLAVFPNLIDINRGGLATVRGGIPLTTTDVSRLVFSLPTIGDVLEAADYVMTRMGVMLWMSRLSCGSTEADPNEWEEVLDGFPSF